MTMLKELLMMIESTEVVAKFDLSSVLKHFESYPENHKDSEDISPFMIIENRDGQQLTRLLSGALVGFLSESTLPLPISTC
jgi:hypothetical protein